MNTTQTITKILATLAILLVVVTGDAAQTKPYTTRRDNVTIAAIA